jgi:hypothetical protein
VKLALRAVLWPEKQAIRQESVVAVRWTWETPEELRIRPLNFPICEMGQEMPELEGELQWGELQVKISPEKPFAIEEEVHEVHAP